MPDAPGWYGKLSAVGDFASRRLAPDWVQACDRWLSAGLQASQQQLGDRWQATYLAAPVWRFAWAPGVIDAQWWFGALMPSCDNAGRYFPLLVVQARAQAPTDRFGLDHLELWWQQVANALLGTLAEGASLDHFEDALQHAAPWPGAAAGPHRLQAAPVPLAGRVQHAVGNGSTLGQLMHGLAAEGLKQQLTGCSLWWPIRHGSMAGHCSVADGLPPADAFVSLLRGDW